jgi:hypothetical protein
MNTKHLAHHYDALTARERVALLLAANVRGDKAEAERLLSTAPMETWRVPHHQTLAEALCDLSLLHLARLLEVVAQFWKTDSLYETNDRDTKKGPDRDRRELRLLAGLRNLATRMIVLQEGWRRFCSELHLDPEATTRDLPGYAIVESTLKLAAVWALTQEEMAAMAAEPVGPPLWTPEGIFADYRATMELRERQGIHP